MNVADMKEDVQPSEMVALIMKTDVGNAVYGRFKSVTELNNIVLIHPLCPDQTTRIILCGDDVAMVIAGKMAQEGWRENQDRYTRAKFRADPRIHGQPASSWL